MPILASGEAGACRVFGWACHPGLTEAVVMLGGMLTRKRERLQMTETPWSMFVNCSMCIRNIHWPNFF